MKFKKLVSVMSAAAILAGFAAMPNVMAEEFVVDVVDLGITFTPSNTNYVSYNLIDLAKDAGAGSSITDSDIITVSYDLDVAEKLSQDSYIDLVSTSPSSSFKNDALTSRYACFRIKNNWEQIDMADCADGMGGSDTTEHQWLNIAGKFDYETTSHVETTINYETRTISGVASGTGSYQSYTEYKFASFPEQAAKGSLYMAIYPGDTGYYTISNVKIRYNKLVTDEKPVVTEKDTVSIDAGFDSKSDGFKSFDIYALAKAAGADSSIDRSDTVKVEYDLDVNKDMSADGFIDLVCKTPNETVNINTFADRFALLKLNSSWDQLDMVDCTQGYGGVNNTAGQWLNISGKFDYEQKTTNHVSVTVDYRNRTVSASGSGSGSYQGPSTYTFGSFPLSAEKGRMFMAVYPNNGEDYVMSNVTVTYDKIVEQPEPDPVAPTAVVTDTVTSDMGDGDVASGVKAIITPNDYTVSGLKWTFTDSDKTGTYETTGTNISGPGTIDYVLYINGYLIPDKESVSVEALSEIHTGEIN